MRDDDDNDRQPLFYLREFPIYATHLIVLVYAVSFFLTAILLAFKAYGFLSLLTFASTDVLKGEVWRVFTYGLYNPPEMPSGLWFVIDMFMIGWFGWELEKFFGRRIFLRFYAVVYVLQPLFFTLIGLWWPQSFAGETGSFALFIAFATLFPDLPFFGRVPAKWLAAIYLAVFTLMDLSERAWPTLAALWLTAGFAFAFMRHEQGRFTLPQFRLGRSKMATTTAAPRSSAAKEAKSATMAEMDLLLDKIARSGLSSLTAKERAQLDAARENLLRNKPPGSR